MLVGGQSITTYAARKIKKVGSYDLLPAVKVQCYDIFAWCRSSGMFHRREAGSRIVCFRLVRRQHGDNTSKCPSDLITAVHEPLSMSSI